MILGWCGGVFSQKCPKHLKQNFHDILLILYKVFQPQNSENLTFPENPRKIIQFHHSQIHLTLKQNKHITLFNIVAQANSQE